jgi:isopentenyl diphosphate isomerase/L-lactate dehydrogenase-like FMN-dependent dehydrogenase
VFVMTSREPTNLADVELAARRRLPRAVYDGIAGGAGDELTVRANRRAYDDVRLVPRVLGPAGPPVLSTTVLGQPVASPVMLAPAGFQRISHPEAELAVARAAGRAGVAFALAGLSSYPMESVAAVATGPRWFQLYQPAGEPAAADALVDRAAAAGFDALCVTVDTAVRSYRFRDARNGFSLPLPISPRITAQVALRPGWAWQLLRGRLGDRPRLRRQGPGHFPAGSALASGSLVRPVTWDDLVHLRRRWSGPLVVKGVLRADQARRLVEDLGVDGLVVSNHGGRILDSGLATLEALPDVVAAVGDRAEVFVDGGVRRGTDVVKALALGARACLVGRPYLYGLAAAGEAGVGTVLQLLHADLTRAMALVGAPDIASIDRSLVRLPGERWGGTQPANGFETTPDVVQALGGTQ